MLALIRRRRRVILVGCGVLALLVAAGLAYGRLRQPRPTVAWDSDPQAVVLRATFCCGFVSDVQWLNTLHAAQIWGDGRIVWVEWLEAGGRRVLTGQLTTEQMTGLLQRYVNAGFFGWDEQYYPVSIVTDQASRCVQVNLTSVGHTVCEYVGGAPAAFQELFDVTTNGVGVAGEAYMPGRGYVTAYQDTFSPSIAAADWPAAALGVTLADVTQGVWLDGEALALAWQIVNDDPRNALVRDGEYYRLTVRLPGLSDREPPTPP